MLGCLSGGEDAEGMGEGVCLSVSTGMACSMDGARAGEVPRKGWDERVTDGRCDWQTVTEKRSRSGRFARASFVSHIESVMSMVMIGCCIGSSLTYRRIVRGMLMKYY